MQDKDIQDNLNLDEEDFIEATDEDGRELVLKTERYFYYNGEEYVLLSNHEDEKEKFVMLVKEYEEDGELFESFEPIDEKLTESILQGILNPKTEEYLDK
ncbi:MAG: DUF1292 domain-containing protein [Eubacteriales bacterium]|nr:DUF1292 domain-containing protein [Eubacteriales bacterium]